MAARMIWSKAACEKLDKEMDLCLDAALFIFEFKPNDVLTVASENIAAVMKELKDTISSKSVDKHQQQKDDVSSIIKECRSKVVNELQYICDNSVSHNKAFVHFISKIQEAHLNADNDTTGKGGTSKKKGKALQLTKLELQQQKDDEKKLNVCLDKQAAVKQLTRDYQKTVRFMERFINTMEAFDEERIILDAFRNISRGYLDLNDTYGYHEEDKWYHLDVSRMIEHYNSKVEKELKEICNKVSDPTIKETFSRHLTDVTAQNHRQHLHNINEKRMSSKQKRSLIQKKKRSRLLMRRRELNSVKNKPSRFAVYEDHSQCCFKINYLDRIYAHLMKSTPKEEECSGEYPERRL